MASTRRFRWGFSLTLLALGAIAWFTLRPSPQDAEAAAHSSFACLFPCGDQALRDAILNTILFIPLGFALRLWLPGLRAWLLTLLATCTIEFTQYAWLLGRDASLRDILTNALGGAIGVALVAGWRDLLRPTPVRGVTLAGAGFGAWLVIIAAGATLVRPSLPATVYWGQWAPALGQFDTWQGQLLDVRVDQHPLPSGRISHSEPLRELLLADSVLVEARIVTGPPTGAIAPITSVFDSDQREIFVLGQRGRDLVFRIRTGLRRLELGGYTIALPDAFGRRGDSMTVAAGIDHGAWILSASGPGAERLATRVPFSAGLVWAGLVPYAFAIDSGMAWLNGLWVGGLLLPLGYWLGASDRRPAMLALLIAAAGVSLGLLARRAGLETPPSAEWIGILFGPMAGWMAGRKLAASLVPDMNAAGPARGVRP